MLNTVDEVRLTAELETKLEIVKMLEDKSSILHPDEDVEMIKENVLLDKYDHNQMARVHWALIVLEQDVHEVARWAKPETSAEEMFRINKEVEAKIGPTPKILELEALQRAAHAAVEALRP